MIKHIFTLIWNKKRSNALIILEIFVAFLIIFAVFSFVVYNVERLREPLGYETDNRWIVNFNIPNNIRSILEASGSDLSDSAYIEETKASLKRQIKNLPPVLNCSYGNGATLPMGGGVWTMGDQTDDGVQYMTLYGEGDEDYAKTLGLNILEGRWFDENDINAKYRPVLINKRLREEIFPDTSALGQVLRINGEMEVIGVFDHMKYYGNFGEETNMSITNYPPFSQNPPVLVIHLKSGTEAAFEEKLNKIIRDTAKDWPFTIYNYESRRQDRARQTWVPMIAILTITLFLLINISLGLFGILWQNVQKRRSEIGLRQAIGAARQHIMYQFTMELVFLASLGIIAGVFFAIQVPLLKLLPIESSIFIKAIAYAALLVYCIVFICAFYPSRQASLIEPATALHEE